VARKALIAMMKTANLPCCEATHRVSGDKRLELFLLQYYKVRAISNEKAFDDCMILSKEAFDPDAVFFDDIVDDDVLPYLSLAVDGLTESGDARKGRLEMRPDDVAANEAMRPSKELPNSNLDPEQLEVYGWESSFWRKLLSYLGF
jgi:hypothetical protein